MIISVPVFFLYHREKNEKEEYVPPPSREEIDITIIPGWDLRKIATDWVEKGLASTTQDVYDLLGEPAKEYGKFNKAPRLSFEAEFPLLLTKPDYVSYEGYIFPDTYRVYADSSLEDVLRKIFTHMENSITREMRDEMNKQGKSFFEILNMAALVEREAQEEDMRMVADIFWRRYEQNWALQSCASVNYVTAKNDPGISAADREIDSPYNTYKYPGLPLGPVSNPSLDAIKAVLNPIKNDYWYFMSGNDGITRYGKTLEEHNINVYRYLR